MKHLKRFSFYGLNAHYLLFGFATFIILGLTISLMTLINSYQEIVQNGMISAMSSVEYPK